MTRRPKPLRDHFFWTVVAVVAAVTLAFVIWYQAVQP